MGLDIIILPPGWSLENGTTLQAYKGFFFGQSSLGSGGSYTSLGKGTLMLLGPCMSPTPAAMIPSHMEQAQGHLEERLTSPRLVILPI